MIGHESRNVMKIFSYWNVSVKESSINFFFILFWNESYHNCEIYWYIADISILR